MVLRGMLAGIAGSNPAGGKEVCLFETVVCFQIEVSETARSLVRRSPTECGVSEYDHETSAMRRPRRSRSVEP